MPTPAEFRARQRNKTKRAKIAAKTERIKARNNPDSIAAKSRAVSETLGDIVEGVTDVAGSLTGLTGDGDEAADTAAKKGDKMFEEMEDTTAEDTETADSEDKGIIDTITDTWNGFSTMTKGAIGIGLGYLVAKKTGVIK